MTKRNTITTYVDDAFYERLKKAHVLRSEISGPGWKSLSLFAAHLLEEGLKIEEKMLSEEKGSKFRTKKANKEFAP